MKYIPGYENEYSATEDGKIYTHKQHKFLALTQNNRGYLSVGLRTGGKAMTYLVHRLIAITYLPLDTTRPTVNHKDGNKLNNNVGNLEWCTQLENVRHANRTGLRVFKYNSFTKHGVYSTYSNEHCRCDKCKFAWNEHMKPYRKNRRLALKHASI